jgi:serine/threonine protein kinase
VAEAETTTVGRYRLIRKLARGGMAEVYLARSQGARGFEKTVAIKRILPHFAQDEQFVRMMVDEAKISVLLNHPNIAQIFEFGEEESEFFLVMEYVGGQSLSKLVKRMRKKGQRMDVLEAVFVVMEMLQGLHAAHTQKNTTGEPANIIHRDVSPQNVLLSWDGHVKVIDFGIARAKNRLERTEVGTIKGKLRYLAPEMIDPLRFSKRGDFDHRVDIFAAGIVLFELVAGRTLFSGANELEVYDMITGAEVPDLAGEGIVDAELMGILQRALAKMPEDRYTNGEDFADDLRGYLYSRDPKFTAKRIAALMQQFFKAEREALLELEKADAEGALSGQREVNLTRTAYTPSSAIDRSKQTTADRRSSASRSRGSKKATGPRIEGLEPGVAPDAETRVALDTDLPPSASHPSYSQRSGTMGGPGGTAVEQHPGWSDEADTRTRLPMPGEDNNDFTPATDTQILASRPPTAPIQKKKKPVVVVLAAAAGISLVLSVLLIVGLMSTETDPPKDPITTVPTDPAKDPIKDPVNPVNPAAGMVPVLVDAEPSTAKVELVGSDQGERTVPAVFMAKAGESIEVRVFAEHHEAQREKVEVPATGDAKVKVTLRAMPVPLIVKTAPGDAAVTVDGQAYRDGMTIAPGQAVKVKAEKSGYVSSTRKVTATPGQELQVALELRKKSSGVKKPPAKSRGSLTITTTPYWGRVTIDGKALEETTPVTVKLSAGVHQVTVSHPPKGLVKRFKVTITPGGKVRKTIQF